MVLFLINLQCDEDKPICNRCWIGARGCIYPPSPQTDIMTSHRKIVQQSKKEDPQHVSDSESTLDDGCFNIDDSEQTGLVKFSGEDSSDTASTVDLFQFDQQALIDSVNLSRINPSNSLFTFPFSGVYPSTFLDGFAQSSSRPNTQELQIPSTLNSIQDSFFFLRFHHKNINEFHRFVYHDYHKFCTTTLMVMVEQSGALRDAVVAFSALIYSMEIDRSVRAQAFMYYASALRQLRIILDQDRMDVEECHMAVATALQLASFDVFLTSLKKLIISVSSTMRKNVFDICMALQV